MDFAVTIRTMAENICKINSELSQLQIKLKRKLFFFRKRDTIKAIEILQQQRNDLVSELLDLLSHLDKSVSENDARSVFKVV